jgi:hypothetical protein
MKPGVLPETSASSLATTARIAPSEGLVPHGGPHALVGRFPPGAGVVVKEAGDHPGDGRPCEVGEGVPAEELRQAAEYLRRVGDREGIEIVREPADELLQLRPVGLLDAPFGLPVAVGHTLPPPIDIPRQHGRIGMPVLQIRRQGVKHAAGNIKRIGGHQGGHGHSQGHLRRYKGCGSTREGH